MPPAWDQQYHDKLEYGRLNAQKVAIALYYLKSIEIGNMVLNIGYTSHPKNSRVNQRIKLNWGCYIQ